MKKIILFLISVGIFVPVLRAQNNVKMVTYFPVPYVAYGDLSAQNLQMGFSWKTEVYVLGNISADSVNVTYGTLKLNATNATGNATTVHETRLQGKSGRTPGMLHPKNDTGTLYLNPSQQNGTTTVVQSLEAKEGRAIMDELYLGNYKFPACSAANYTIAWQELTVSGRTGFFLTCGASTTGPTCTPGQTEERLCGANDSGKKTCTCKNDGSGWACGNCMGNRWSEIKQVCTSSYDHRELTDEEGDCAFICQRDYGYALGLGRGEPPLCVSLQQSDYVPEGEIDFDAYEFEGQPCSTLGGYDNVKYTVSGHEEVGGDCMCDRTVYAAECERGQIPDN